MNLTLRIKNITFHKIRQAQHILSIGSLGLKLSNFLLIIDRKKDAQRVLAFCINKLRKNNKEKDAFFNMMRINYEIVQKLIETKSLQKNIRSYQKEIAKNPPKIAIYTAISGNYDVLLPPSKIDSRFKYIVYSDTPIDGYGIYEVRPITYFDSDKTRPARYLKTHPHFFLNDYDVVVWIDANIMQVGDIHTHLDSFINSKKPFGAIRHPIRDSVYQEGKECIKRNKDEKSAISEQLKAYKKEGFDCDDLIESNVLFFNLKKSKTSKFLTTWWKELDSFSKRDQISLNYSLQKHNVEWHRIMDRPLNARNHQDFALIPHGVRIRSLKMLKEQLNTQKTDPYDVPVFSKVDNEVLAPHKKDRVDVVLCVHNAYVEVKRCLEAIKNNRNNANLKLIIVDDGSEQETKELLEEFTKNNKKWTKIIRNEKAGGYTKAANTGLRASTGDLVVLLNSDTVPTTNWTEKLLYVASINPGVGIIGPLSSAASHQSIPEHMGTKTQTAINDLPEGYSFEDMNTFCENTSKATLFPRVPLVHGFCFAVTRHTIKTIGYLDEKSFPRGYGEENDYCFRAVNAGIGLAIATNTYVYHEKSKSYKGKERIKLMQEGSRNFKKLHGSVRVKRAVRSMQENPLLIEMRKQASKLYR